MPEKIILVAMTENRVIGREGGLPWRLPEDLRLFRKVTMGCSLIMGRKTFQSLDGPLDGRENIVVSRKLPSGQGYRVCPGFQEALALGEELGRKIFIIGGVGIFREALPIADVLAVSWVKGEYPGDVFFPGIDFSAWEVFEETPYPGFRHVCYRRRKG